MTGLELAAVLLVGLLVLGASIYFGLRTADTTWARQREEITRLNLALAGVAEATGLRLVGGGEHTHPTMGKMPGFASLHGIFRGHGVHLSVERRGDEVYEDVMRVEVVPAVGRFGKELSSSQAACELSETATVHASPTKLEVEPRAGEERHHAQLHFTFPSDPREIKRVLELSVRAASELSSA
jgi:hypothetical protein